MTAAAHGPDTVNTDTDTSARPHGQELADLILSRLEDDKAEDIITIDLSGKSDVADAMIIASGRSQRHVGAVADQVITALRENGHGKPRVEGLPHCDWVLVDAGDVILHIFRPEVREFYNIEKMWQADFAADQH